MPISQFNRTNPVEQPPQPEQTRRLPERETTVSPEVPKVEYSRDQLAERREPVAPGQIQLPAQPAFSGRHEVDAKFKLIESILEEDLGDVYFALSAEKQQEFKSKGEEVTLKIISLLAKPRIQIKKIMSLIRDWLKVIPGINRFFLEQTVKIKADKIIDEAGKRY